MRFARQRRASAVRNSADRRVERSELSAADQRSVLHGSISVADSVLRSRGLDWVPEFGDFTGWVPRLPDLPGTRRRKYFLLDITDLFDRQDIGRNSDVHGNSQNRPCSS